MEILISQSDLLALKGHELVPLKCVVCKGTFLKRKQALLQAMKGAFNKNATVCNPKCRTIRGNQTRYVGEKASRTVECHECGIAFQRTPAAIGKHVFCNHKCSAIYQNKHKTTGYRRSVAEEHLINLISNAFPALEIKPNVRDFLPSGLEIDILLPSLKIAIELNGPVHFFPIYGQDRLELIQNRDFRKQQEIHAAGFSLIIVDISQNIYRKKQLELLNSFYVDSIHPILSTLLKT